MITRTATARLCSICMCDASSQHWEPGVQVCPSNYTKVLLQWIEPENLPEYLGGTSKATLLDDAGPWQDPKIMAEVSLYLTCSQGAQVELACFYPLLPPWSYGPLVLGRHTLLAGRLAVSTSSTECVRQHSRYWPY